MGGARNSDRDGGRPRPRQSGVHRAAHQPHRRTPAGPGAQTRPVPGARVPPRAARFGVVGGAFHGAAGHGAGSGVFRPRSAVAGGRPVPGLEGDDGNSPPRRSGWRVRGQKAAFAARAHLRSHPDHHDRHRLFGRQYHHGRGHDGVFSNHGHRRRRGGRGDDGRRGAAGGVHPPQSDRFDAGAELPPDDRHDADRRRFRLSYRKRLYLRRDVFFRRGRDAQRLGAAQAQTTYMTFSSLILFAAVYFAAVATPGPGVAALIARVLGQGLKGVGPFIAGYFVGDMIWLTLAATGLAVIAKTFAGVFIAIKFAGAAYLLYLAWRMATAPAVIGAAPTEATLGNAKVMVFFLSIMPLVVDVRTLSALALFELALVCGVVISSTLTLYALAANRARTLLRSTRAMRFVKRAARGLMAGVAVAVATR